MLSPTGLDLLSPLGDRVYRFDYSAYFSEKNNQERGPIDAESAESPHIYAHSTCVAFTPASETLRI